MALAGSLSRLSAGSSSTAFTRSAIAVPLLIALAVTGIAEVLIHRIAGAVAVNVGAPSWLGQALAIGGSTFMAATALLAVGLGIVLLLGSARHHRTAVALALGAVVAGPLLGGSGFAWAARVAVMVALAIIVSTASGPAARRVALLAIGFGVAAGQAALQWTEAGLGLRMAGEAAVMAGVVLLAAVTLADRRVSAPGWMGAVAAGSIVTFAFVFQPGYTALAALWTWGATLWLPPLFYIAGAAAAGLLLVTWIRDPATPHLAAGLMLLAVAGLPPALAQHNLTAVLALAALSTMSWPAERET